MTSLTRPRWATYAVLGVVLVLSALPIYFALLLASSLKPRFNDLMGASPFGIYDMSGNVEEWVADWYAETVSDLSPRAGASHVLRGGGWLSAPSAAKTTSRNWGSSREMGPNVGFRCAKDATD